MALTREQLKAMFAKKKFNKLPDELQDDILDATHPSGLSIFTSGQDYDETSIQQRETFLNQYSTEDLKDLKMKHIKEKEFDKGAKAHMKEQMGKGVILRSKILATIKNSEKPVDRFQLNDKLGGGTFPEVQVLVSQKKVKMSKAGKLSLI